jgi:hypothetical protein
VPVQVGLTEAYGEALNAQLAMLRYALEGTPGRRALAVFVASNYRRNAPLVHQIVVASNPAFERALEAVIRDLQAAASPLDSERLADVIAGAYARLGTHRGQQTWTEAARRTRVAMRVLAIGEPLAAVEDEGGDLVAAARPAGEHDDGPHQFLAQRLRSIKIAIRQETVRINSTIVATSAEDTRGSTPSPNRDLDKIPVARRAI